MFSGSVPERTQSQGSLPPLDSPCLVSGSSSRVQSYGKSPSQTDRYQVYKLQEQIKTYQDEIQRKDKVIEEMSKLELKGCPDKFIDSTRSSSRAVYADKEEVAALHVKLDNLKSQLSDTSSDLHRKDAAVETLKRLNGQLREELARQQVVIDNSGKQVEDYNDAKEAFDVMRRRNDMLINSLQRELTESQEQVLQTKIENKQLENDIAELFATKEYLQTQMNEMKTSLALVTSSDVNSVQEVVDKVKTLRYEKECAENKLMGIDEKLKSRDCEQQASRQTITRLVSKLSAEEAKHTAVEENLSSLKKEMEQSAVQKSIMESETETLLCKIQSLSKELELSQRDNDVKTKRIQELSGGNRSTKYNDEQLQILNQFIEDVVEVLSQTYKKPVDDSYTVLEWILGCIKSLLQSKDDASNLHDTIDSLKSEVLEMEKITSETSDHVNIHSQVAIEDLKARLDDSQKMLANASLTIDQLNCDKTKYFRILAELAQVMNMSEINKDIGFDMISEALYSRAAQLQKREFEAQTDQRINEHSLQRKLKELKERANSKDLHIDLLHKKLAALDGKQLDKVTAEKERDKELSCNKRLLKYNQKQQEEIESLREEVVLLKTKLIDNGRAQSRIIALEQELRAFNLKIEKLETVRQKQSKLLNEFKSSHSTKDNEHSDYKLNADRAIMSLNDELQLVKSSLDDSKRKEQQMLELRAVISRLLGLDLDALAIPDFEIVNRLERLITAHQSNVYTAYSMDTALRDMNQGFYHDPCTLHHQHTYITDERPIYPKYDQNQTTMNCHQSKSG